MSDNFLPPGYSFDILNNITILKSYFEFGETNIEKEIELIRQKFYKSPTLTYKMLKDDPTAFDEEKSRLEDMYYENLYNMDMEIRSRFRQSLIIQLFSFMEVHLYKQCELHKKRNHKEYSVKDLNGNSDLDKVAKYIKYSAGIDIKALPHWRFIDNLRKLRNNIVHKEGRIVDKDSYNGIKEFAVGNFELTKGIDEYEYQIILSKRDFIDYCIDEVSRFLHGILIA